MFNVGSVNPIKVGAVVDALRRYSSFEDFEVVSVSCLLELVSNLKV